MLKILTAEQVRVLDAQTIESEPVASIDLMERASLAFVKWFVPRFDNRKTIGIICGTGNNGGDGLAVARLLRERHYQVKVWIVPGAKETPDFIFNRNRLAVIETNEITTQPRQGAFEGIEILVDALFGSGLSRPLTGIYAAVVVEMNRASAIRIAIDIPSGLMADQPSEGEIVNAQHTVTFQLPKLAFMFPESHNYVGEWHVVDIGLSPSYLDAASTSNFFITEQWVRSQIRPRKKFAHKGDVGRSLLVSGSHGKMGAAILAARALLRTGAGLLTVHVPGCGYDIIQSTVPEALVTVDKNKSFITNPGNLQSFDAIGIGPGIDTNAQTAKAFQSVLKAKKPTVVDADALNILAKNKKTLRLLPPMTILTPHPGEFKRICGEWANDFERLERLRQFARDIGCIVILKGAHTSIAIPDGRVFFNSSGNPAMATGGSGDVLTGLLTSLLAQGYDPIMAAAVGVFVHGRAGDMALTKVGGGSIIASDIVDMIPHGFQSLFR